jgi:hypothetical protein
VSKSQPKPADKPKARYKLLAGVHYQKGIKYVPGQIVESDSDLVALFGRTKFAREISDEQRETFAKAVREIDV